MQEMIVLGEIPGTNIQLTFTAWTYFSTVVLILFILVLTRRQVNNRLNGYIAQSRARKVLRLLSQYHLL